ncbi:OadG family protein [Halomonas sp. McH1-25]|uniref:OadG family protein n=1 Tax=unclassified Halomonas TaxID=2609666 RepID=UPI001EF45666|nr:MULTISPECIES: OadG family transporter subunit [unclassified Halomonas]MCG7601449.1 OadG family protein [Halomonas sp. McH1-25]MCP1341990.1 OadG family transporter subunit [Halomonas sp. FL8]MCP1363361.1 OadG family transporter subunit [Halomonas sp. BBD45]
MSDSQLIQEGLSLMAFGMGFVFVFLTLLVFATTGMSRLVMRFVPAPVKEEASRQAPPPARTDDDVMAAISVAVHRYRQRHRR